MKLQVPVSINWLPPELGGRQVPPMGDIYYGSVQFEGDAMVDEVGWTLVLTWLPQVEHSSRQFWMASFLADDEIAPLHFLYKGSKFRLVEGPHRVAEGIVLENP